MNSKFLIDIDYEAPIESNLEFLDKCIADLKNRRRYLKNLKKKRDNKELLKQLDLVIEIQHEESNNRSHDQDNLPSTQQFNTL